MSIKIEIDQSLDAAYITLSDEAVTRTVEHNNLVLIDLDQFGVAVGIEVLSEDAPLPFRELVEQYHVHSDVVDLLRLIRPNIAQFVLDSAPDGHSVAKATELVDA